MSGDPDQTSPRPPGAAWSRTASEATRRSFLPAPGHGHNHGGNRLIIGPMTAAGQPQADRIAGDPESKAICGATMTEIMQLADALGLDFAPDPDERVALALKLGPFRTSILQLPVPSTRAICGLTRLPDASLAAA